MQVSNLVTRNAAGAWSQKADINNNRGVARSSHMGPRAVITAGGVNTMEVIPIGIPGVDAVDFGDGVNEVSSCAGGTDGNRGMTWGGSEPPYVDTIGYFNFISSNNAQDFGNLVAALAGKGQGANDGNRAVDGGGEAGYPTGTSVIQFVTVGTTGNATDYGEFAEATGRSNGPGVCSNGSRGVWGGGTTPGVSPDIIDLMTYITIAIGGTAVDFGEMISALYNRAAVSDGSRGVWTGGYTGNTDMEYRNIATTGAGTSLDFGNLTSNRAYHSGAGDGNRGVIMGGNGTPMNCLIDYWSIGTLGNAIDWGQKTTAGHYAPNAVSGG